MVPICSLRDCVFISVAVLPTLLMVSPGWVCGIILAIRMRGSFLSDTWRKFSNFKKEKKSKTKQNKTTLPSPFVLLTTKILFENSVLEITAAILQTLNKIQNDWDVTKQKDEFPYKF
jgi:hypothetical protein